jgi:hypothetical protein
MTVVYEDNAYTYLKEGNSLVMRLKRNRPNDAGATPPVLKLGASALDVLRDLQPLPQTQQ